MELHSETTDIIFDSYTSEVLKEIEDKQGRLTYQWMPIKSHPSNHWRDCSVYTLYLADKFDVKFRKQDYVLPETQKVIEAQQANPVKADDQSERGSWLSEF